MGGPPAAAGLIQGGLVTAAVARVRRTSVAVRRRWVRIPDIEHDVVEEYPHR
ncbi:MAG: hypothetical protein IID05_01955 [Gemmatimonadetes bacterium]|nr:hypothetical protein [Gemmatimonadota bacterium]